MKLLLNKVWLGKASSFQKKKKKPQTKEQGRYIIGPTSAKVDCCNILKDMDQSKVVLMERPPVYSELPIPCFGGVKKLVCVVLVVVVLVLVLVGVLLMGLHMSQKHTETIFQMSLQEGTSSGTQGTGVATFHLDTGINSSASVVYDYSKLLIAARPRPGHACYVTQMDPEQVQSLETIAESVLSKITSDASRQNDSMKPVTDRSLLGITIKVLCGSLPVYWA
ncbi:surfactant, pulmonary-associated protein C S homeolog isoform X3 [Xenopus laevis]|uniref:Surfactant protein C n=1 Tax=Xenopus laevis TaxID=8355 RepID=A0A8J1MQJ2_XENLA|nr:surfactant, pulmonary-associated protein C S homeolog isoform X2 [Xenopus laevis]XP_041443663.1 surfactant, pulmonary-associated protein C S homeolog isoform X3 [Xenopus laevis]